MRFSNDHELHRPHDCWPRDKPLVSIKFESRYIDIEIEDVAILHDLVLQDLWKDRLKIPYQDTVISFVANVIVISMALHHTTLLDKSL